MSHTILPRHPAIPEPLCGAIFGSRVCILPAGHVEDELRSAVEDLRVTIMNRGPNPSMHDKIMQRHRREWPTLWRAIDHLLRS